jgi:decaprenylphospho-beta-D-ribofuranose 2-oxidase
MSDTLYLSPDAVKASSVQSRQLIVSDSCPLFGHDIDWPRVAGRDACAPTMAKTETIKLSGWGRYLRRLSTVTRPEKTSEAVPPTSGHMIVRGQGRSYNEAAMSADGLVMLSERLDRIIAFDETTGVLRAEAGTTLATVLDQFVPRGWFPPVTPGTKVVSLGGCVAADVHGKNHHRDGAFGAHVAALEIVLADGNRRQCSPQQEAELFWATIGGMGLTGIIREVSFRLRPIETAYLVVEHRRASELDELLTMLEDQSLDDHYSVAWIDCLARGRSMGRGILMRGHHAEVAALQGKVDAPLRLKMRRRLNLSFDLPSGFLNTLTCSAFNRFYYWLQGRHQTPFISDYESFFYPLDGVGNWNRIYGPRGFVQYQCVFPPATARRGLRILLAELAGSGRASFLGVLKRFGPEGEGLLSFPMEGYTLAIDLPVTNPDLFTFLDGLDEIVMEHGGRVYLAKNPSLKPEIFRAMYPRLPEWERIKARVDPANRFSSDLSRMLEIGTKR